MGVDVVEVEDTVLVDCINGEGITDGIYDDEGVMSHVVKVHNRISIEITDFVTNFKETLDQDHFFRNLVIVHKQHDSVVVDALIDLAFLTLLLPLPLLHFHDHYVFLLELNFQKPHLVSVVAYHSRIRELAALFVLNDDLILEGVDSLLGHSINNLVGVYYLAL